MARSNSIDTLPKLPKKVRLQLLQYKQKHFCTKSIFFKETRRNEEYLYTVLGGVDRTDSFNFQPL